MKQVIRLEEKKKKPIEFTHIQDSSGWSESIVSASDYDKVVYLGDCVVDGDMFACYTDGYIEIFKGHLNDGVY